MKHIFSCAFLCVATIVSACKGTNDAESKKSTIEDWFDQGAAQCDITKDLHLCSQWKYMTAAEYEEMTLDGIDKLNPPLKDGESIFELGVGAGAALQVLMRRYPNVVIGGSDFAKNAIDIAKKVFPKYAHNFYHHDMTKKHEQISDNHFDHVVSFGALAWYLTKEDMLLAIKEAARMTKPGGSLVFTVFVEPTGKKIGSIVDQVPKSFWAAELPKLGIENIQTFDMKHQGDRYQMSCNKIP